MIAERENNLYPKLEDITYEKKKGMIDQDDGAQGDDTKGDDKKLTGAMPEDSIKVDMKFSIIGRFFNKVNELRGKKKTE